MSFPSGDTFAPVVSVIVPTYNRLRLLKETVSSILSQTYAGFELIIVDNMSTDGTEAFIKSIDDKRVRYFRNPNNGVIAVNRNLGIKNAGGRLIAFCDDDDLWLKDKLETQVRYMEANPDTGLCFGYAEDFGPSATSGLLRFSKKESDSISSFESLFLGNKIATLTVMVRKVCLDNVGLFDENPELMALEDYDLWLRIARRYKIACVGQILGRYRIHPASVSRNEVLENKKLLKLFEKFRDNGWVSGRLARQVESNIDRMIANAMLLRGEKTYRGLYLRSAGLCLNKNTALGLGLCLLPTTLASRVLKRLKSSKRERLHKAE